VSITFSKSHLLGAIAESDSVYCNRCQRGLFICMSVCPSVTLVHLARAVRRNEMPLGRDTRVVPSNIVLGARSPDERGDLGVGTPVKMCITNCGQTVTYSGMVTTDSLLELSNALSNGTIVDPNTTSLPQNNMFAAMPPSAKWRWSCGPYYSLVFVSSLTAVHNNHAA